MNELKPCPFCGLPAQIHGDFNMEALSCSDRTGDCPGSWAALSCRTPPQRAEAIAAWNRRAQPATDKQQAAIDNAAAFARGHDAGWASHELHVSLQKADAAPSVAPEPVEMRPYNPTEAMRWAAKRIDPALPHEHIRSLWCVMWSAYAHPPRAPLTEEQRRDLVKECGLDWQRGYMPLFEGDPTNRYAVLVEAVEAAHGIGGK